MTPPLYPVVCKACGHRLLDTDGAGRVAIVCRWCGVYNDVKARLPLPPLARRGPLGR